jgi:hypothetical protein
MALDQGRDVAVVRSGQQIAVPMARHRPIFNRRRSLEACPSESLSDWIAVHANLFRFLFD